jgi:hypothetical protein
VRRGARRATWRRSEWAELERRDASGARWCRWSCSTRCATSGGGGGRDAAAAAFDIASRASPARELVAGLAFELGWRRERVGLSDRGGGWWPLDREMDGSDRGRQSRCSRRC